VAVRWLRVERASGNGGFGIPRCWPVRKEFWTASELVGERISRKAFDKRDGPLNNGRNEVFERGVGVGETSVERFRKDDDADCVYGRLRSEEKSTVFKTKNRTQYMSRLIVPVVSSIRNREPERYSKPLWRRGAVFRSPVNI